jgi:HAD superfamily hydrolase (TIGR01509 family)
MQQSFSHHSRHQELAGECVGRSGLGPTPITWQCPLVVSTPPYVCCDFDGTLVQNFKAHFLPYALALHALGGPALDEAAAKEVYLNLRGTSEPEFGKNYLEKFSSDYPALANLTPQNFLDERAKKLRENVANLEIELEKSLVRVLRSLRSPEVASGVQRPVVILCTSSSEGFVTPILEHFGLTELFDHLVCSDKFTPRTIKPAPDQYREAASIMRVHPQEITTFEDSIAGVTAAQQAGIGRIIVRPVPHLVPGFIAEGQKTGVFEKLAGVTTIFVQDWADVSFTGNQ